MKKYFLITSLLVFVFLWLGGFALACNTQLITTYLNCPTWQSCTIPSASDYSDCTLADCPPCGNISDGQTCDVTACPSTSSTTTTTPCFVAGSDLSGDVHAVTVLGGLSCKCIPTYGTYYDTTLKRNQCGLCTSPDVCCGTKLNTSIPFVGNCIETSSQASGSVITDATAFPILVSSLVKILVSVILIVSFIIIIAAGVMISTGGANVKKGKDWIINVAIGLAILGASGIILHLINPNFFW